MIPSGGKKLKLMVEMKEISVIIRTHEIVTATNYFRIINLEQRFKSEVIQDYKGSG